ncbi:P-loop containing nucleoside triphosphate hydrolase protein [Lobosporangium transversale]|uniref:p-loop containing nucleoside triphosphate hydrolase protein n=1 Tax=Lobosporangium transversale TaxID=64571 RepID=A0A1Y2GRR1_9FUNG|nr:P-loop containing nucleoside triphosphate hydrolase protein [Lobosporangium transversale]ORZ20162.1 P-loop containing nucleoside triphosphate hydrolase protein [Lobosporangium transversale]|eukprot:XP_021882702.1 P-loop containing nucleoside triphosphate hydrolase protein [Lobosporangium transversale]
MGDVINTIATQSVPDAVAGLRIIVIKFTVIGAIMFVMAYGQMCLFTLAAESQTKRIREKYLHAILRQDITWHDVSKKSESLNSRLSADTQLVFDGLADKVGLCLSSLATFVAGFVIAFTHGWKMSLVLLTSVPLMAAVGALMAKYTINSTTDGQDAYAKAGGLAEQAIGSIRTVVAFDGQNRELKKFNEVLADAYKSGIKKAYATGLGMGGFMFVLFCSYALAFWYGAREVKAGNMDPGNVLVVLFGTIIGAFSIGNVGPNLSLFAKAQAAAYTIFKTIDRVPEIDSFDPSGLKPEKLTGHIVVKDVNFSYPSRPNVPILKNMNIEVKPGQTVALVGHSGSGKSTIIGLLERFYDPTSGSITIDGIALKDINVRHLRDTIGLVSQEPVLFNATIKQNILYGIRHGQKMPTDKEIEDACRLSNAHDFISKLPNGYHTMVGEKGALLSGGQKQRIAIARALIKNPAILLLDEATSALDTESERIVQAALDNAATGRSTVVIAHRLSTIMNADLIYVMDRGVVLEHGTHASLMALGGIYTEFVAKQQLKTGGVDVEAPVTAAVEKSDKPATSSASGPHIAIADPVAPEGAPRSGRRMSHLLRRKSSQHSVTRSEKSADGSVVLNIPEDKEASLAREKKEASRRLKMQKAPIARTIRYMKDDAVYFAFGVFFAIIQGGLFPAFAQIFAKAQTTLTEFYKLGDEFIPKANMWALWFFILAIIGFTGFCGGMIMFLIVGERMTRRMRYLSYKSILSQEMAFFDRPENSTGALASRLATDSQQMFDMVSQVILTSVSSLATMAVGLGFAFSSTWEMTLIILAAVPVIGLGQYLEIAALSGFGEKTRKAYEKSGQVAGEAISNIRTVVSLAKEETFEARYFEVTKEPHKYARNKAVFASFGFAMSQAVAYWSYSIGFYGGYRLIENGIITYEQMFTCMFSVVFTAMSLGHITSELPKYAKGKQSAINIYELLDKDTTIDADRDGIKLDRINGSLGLEKVDFTYPTRKNIQIFNHVDINVKPSQTVALVGPSGCGKSTIIALLERWYEADGGKVIIDNHDIRDLQLHNIRNHMALVGQEPVLFDMTIKDNILYGLPEGEGTMEQVYEAAKLANIHNFVMSLPNGYDTGVGDKGSQLSGGQKQRIAIARALIRNPKVLLLDEATSALDSESEKLVQEALDKARYGRTTIVIAHRLSTIQDADLILVVKGGTIVESGRHYELVALGGVYADLCQKQNL